MSRRLIEGKEFYKVRGRIMRTPYASMRMQEGCEPRTRKQRKEEKMLQKYLAANFPVCANQYE